MSPSGKRGHRGERPGTVVCRSAPHALLAYLAKLIRHHLHYDGLPHGKARDSAGVKLCQLPGPVPLN